MSEMDQRLGSRYVLRERLGRGAMGTVWRARNTDTGADVAVKVLSEELSDEPEMVTRFIQERNTLISVNHPNLVRIHDLVVEDGRLAIVMDLVAGPDLHRYLAERGVLGLQEVALIGRGVAEALGAIHAAGIIHRDLKPANILLDLGGPRPLPKLVDFGIARMVAGSRLTARSSVVGTPQYLSPEAISGAEPSSSVDVYAFGIALYELLTGAPPFNGGQLLQVLNQHMYQEPPWPPQIPPQILPLLQAMLAKNPQARPSAAEITTAMDALLAGAPVDLSAAAPGAAVPPQQQVPQQQQQQALPAAPQQPAAQSPLPSGHPLPPGQWPYQDSPYQQAPQPQPQPGYQAQGYPGVQGPVSQPQPGPGQPSQTPIPGAYGPPLPPRTPIPGAYGPPQQPQTPIPGGYGPPPGPQPQTPIPSPSPSGFFYPKAEMFEPGSAVSAFTPSPPPFNDSMLRTQKPKRSRKKLVAVGGGTVAVLAVVGVVAALMLSKSGGGTPTPVIVAGSGTGGHTTASASPGSPSTCPAEAAVGALPAAYWTLSGNGDDCSRTPSTTDAFALSGGAAWTSTSRGKALQFQSASAVATAQNDGIVNTANSFTVSIWVELDSFDKTKSATVIAFQSKTDDSFDLEYNAGWQGWAFNHTTVQGPGAQWVAAAANKALPKTYSWTHLVGVYSAKARTMTLYENNRSVATHTGVTGWNGDYDIVLGANTTPNGTTYAPLAGRVSDLQIFGTALSAGQVASIP